MKKLVKIWGFLAIFVPAGFAWAQSPTTWTPKATWRNVPPTAQQGQQDGTYIEVSNDAGASWQKLNGCTAVPMPASTCTSTANLPIGKIYLFRAVAYNQYQEARSTNVSIAAVGPAGVDSVVVVPNSIQ